MKKEVPLTLTVDECTHIWKCMQTSPKKYDTPEHKNYYKQVVIPNFRELTGRDLPSFSSDKKGS